MSSISTNSWKNEATESLVYYSTISYPLQKQLWPCGQNINNISIQERFILSFNSKNVFFFCLSFFFTLLWLRNRLRRNFQIRLQIDRETVLLKLIQAHDILCVLQGVLEQCNKKVKLEWSYHQSENLINVMIMGTFSEIWEANKKNHFLKYRFIKFYLNVVIWLSIYNFWILVIRAFPNSLP